MTRAFPNWDDRAYPIPSNLTRFPNGGNGYVNPVADPYWDNVVLMMNMAGTHGAEDAVELSSGRTVTWVSADVQSTQAKFGDTSLRTFGTGQYIRFADSDDFSMQSGDYTFECWAYTEVNSGGAYISKYNASGGNAEYFLAHNGTELNFLYFYDSSNFIWLQQSWAVATGQWNHIATDRVGDDFFLYFGGTMISSLNHGTGQHFNNKTETLRIGRRNHSSPLSYDGWIDEVRITKGIGRYGGVDFTPPVGPFPLF